jgi:hypothetical protein
MRRIWWVKWQDYIEESKDVMLREPVFKGPRLTIEHVATWSKLCASPDAPVTLSPRAVP